MVVRVRERASNREVGSSHKGLRSVARVRCRRREILGIERITHTGTGPTMVT